MWRVAPAAFNKFLSQTRTTAKAMFRLSPFRFLPCLMLINVQHGQNYVHILGQRSKQLNAPKEYKEPCQPCRKWLKFDAVKQGQRVVKEPQSASNCHSGIWIP